MTNPSEPLLLDTSVWVRHWRRRGAEDLKRAVREALVERRIATCWVVKTELLLGARDLTSLEALREALDGLPNIPITETIWADSASLGYGLRKRGLLVHLPDLLIAQCAISSGRVLWHVDSDFERIRQLSPLRTTYWQAADGVHPPTQTGAA